MENNNQVSFTDLSKTEQWDCLNNMGYPSTDKQFIEIQLLQTIITVFS